VGAHAPAPPQRRSAWPERRLRPRGLAGDHAGRDEALTVLAEVSALAPRELVAIDEVLTGPGAAVVVVRERLARGDETHELRRVLRYRIEGGKLTECWLYDEDQALVDRLWA
jgi:hypothetical protein